MKTFFAHQSVGANILTGLQELTGPERTAVHVLDLTRAHEPHSAQPLLIIHEQIGVNREPLTKIAAFRERLNAKHRLEVDVAMLKFCYVDISTRHDAETLWKHYEAAIEQLSTDRPGVQLVHCTVPLRSLPEGPYAGLRRALGHRHPAIVANRARDWFNQQLRARFGTGHDLFDLAAVQSRRPDGRPCELVDGDTRVPSLARDWTYDGGHLNEPGRTMAAAAFLEFLQTLQDLRKR